MTEPDFEPAVPDRIEVCWMVLVTIAAGFVRFAFLSREGISHFDEGVYVLSGAGTGYPMQEFFAPPLFPLSLRAVFAVLGPSDLAAKGLSAAIGTATVPLVWWLARRWFGRVAAAACPPLVAFSGLHIAISRMALTDALFVFVFLLAVWLISELFARCVRPELTAEWPNRSIGGRGVFFLAIAAGLAAGAAMNTKYNGFLTLAIAVGAAGVCAAWPSCGKRLSWPILLGATLTFAVIAVACYVPWYLHVERTYGYSRLIGHHRGYTSGLASWMSNLCTLIQEQRALNGPLGWVGLFLGSLAAAVTSGRTKGLTGPCVVGLAMLLQFEAGDAVLWLFGPLFLAVTARRPIHAVLLVWLGVLFALTPFYRPYARLLLPLSAAGWIAFAALTAAVLRQAGENKRTEPKMWAALVTGGLAILAVLLFVGWLRPQPGDSRDERRTLADACETVVSILPPDETVCCFVRPPALFYVAANRRVRLMNPDADLAPLIKNAPSGRTFVLVDGALVRDNPRLGERLAVAGARLRDLVRAPYWPGQGVALDDFGRDALRAESLPRMQKTYELILFAIEPVGE